MTEQNTITNVTYDELTIGQVATASHTITDNDIKLFGKVSGDVNPAHFDEEYAKETRFKGIIAHGMLSGSFISAALGTQLPGPGTIYLEQALKFLRPVHIGDTLTTQITVLEKNEKNRVLLDCKCINQEGKIVTSGNALVIAPTDKISRPRLL